MFAGSINVRDKKMEVYYPNNTTIGMEIQYSLGQTWEELDEEIKR